MRVERFEHRFVEHFPEQLDVGVLYISMSFASAAHLCACGCGKEVVTPLSPVAWRLTFDGEGVSLSPSIGNWSFPCRSHYWIEKSEVDWSYDMSERQIRAGRARAQAARTSHFGQVAMSTPASRSPLVVCDEPPRHGAWARLLTWLHRK